MYLLVLKRDRGSLQGLDRMARLVNHRHWIVFLSFKRVFLVLMICSFAVPQVVHFVGHILEDFGRWVDFLILAVD